MSLTIETKKESICKKRKFCIYDHVLSMKDLDEYILDILFEPNKLNYLFHLGADFDDFDRINQLRRFLETDFYSRENDITDIDLRTAISVNNNNSYYSFFAEALMARLNIDYIDDKLVTAVIAVDDTITTTTTGADVCMHSEDKLVIGEAKFYGDLLGGVDSILTDVSFSSKLDSYINKLIKLRKDIVLKNIDGVINRKTKEEIIKISLIFTGFILHQKSVRENYSTSYDRIDNIDIENFPDHYEIHLYHLPVESKNELIFKAQRKALDLIIELQNA